MNVVHMLHAGSVAYYVVISTVFGDMFTNDSLTGAEINIPTKTPYLYILLLYIQESPGGIFLWKDTIRTINLARQYGCDDIARKILYDACLVDPDEKRFEAFALASQLDHHLSACRILLFGHSGQGSSAKGEPSLLPDTWNSGQISQLSPMWIWALTTAVQTANAAVEGMRSGSGSPLKLHRFQKEERYWRTVAGEFILLLVTKCEFSVIFP